MMLTCDGISGCDPCKLPRMELESPVSNWLHHERADLRAFIAVLHHLPWPREHPVVRPEAVTDHRNEKADKVDDHDCAHDAAGRVASCCENMRKGQRADREREQVVNHQPGSVR